MLIALLAEPSDKTLTGQWLPKPVRGEAIFGEAEIKHGGHRDGRRAELFLLLGIIGAADVPDGAFVTEGREELQHGGGSMLKVALAVSGGRGVSPIREESEFEGGEQVNGSTYAARGSQSAIDVEETYRVLHKPLFERRVDTGSFGHFHGASKLALRGRGRE